MTNDLLFQLSSTAALAGWLLLILVPAWKWTPRLVTGGVVVLLSVLYAVLIFGALKPSDMQSFGSLEGVVALFEDPRAVLGGWIHYLAFDLMVGLYIVQNASRYGIHRLLLLPCLLFTFMLGPAGLLLYFLIRLIRTRRYFEATPG